MTENQAETSIDAAPKHYDAIVVGAGIAGMYALYRLRELGLSVRVFEKGGGVGGTWYWNRYPGARCDVESWDYSYSFSPELDQEWEWTERYPTQAELERYFNHVADRFDLKKDIQFDTRLDAAHYDEAANRWLVQTSDGGSFSATYLVMATGGISELNTPSFKGQETFQGQSYHTARWPREGVDLRDKRVGVIGTGSTGVQLITEIAPIVDHLTVFQRTAQYAVPAQNHPLDPEVAKELKKVYPERRALMRTTSNGLARIPLNRSALEVDEETRQAAFEEAWQRGGAGYTTTFNDILTDEQANAYAGEFVNAKIRERVKDPTMAEKLCGKYMFGTKRTVIDIAYYETYNRDNVTLVDIRESPIEEITPTGIRTTDGDYDLDVIVFAIGFDGMTGALFAIDVQGEGGRSLREKWSDGPLTYLGLMTAGFPNLFTITGPGSPAVLSNVIVSIEQHVDWVTDLLRYTRERGLDRVEADPEAERAWTAHVDELANKTLLPKADSWWNGTNIPGKRAGVVMYVGGVGNYRKKCDEVAEAGYPGFVLTSTGAEVPTPEASVQA